MIEPVQDLVKNVAINACDIPLKDHMDLIYWSNFWSGFVAVCALGLVNMGIKAFPYIKARNSRELIVNIVLAFWRGIFTIWFPAMWRKLTTKGNDNDKTMGPSGPGQQS